MRAGNGGSVVSTKPTAAELANQHFNSALKMSARGEDCSQEIQRAHECVIEAAIMSGKGTTSGRVTPEKFTDTLSAIGIDPKHWDMVSGNYISNATSQQITNPEELRCG